jgi:nucleoside-diphosphate-sugar epimerase
MKVLITGKNGFFGKEFINHFKNKNCEVIAIGRDNLDLTNPIAVNCFMNIHKEFDVILHCAIAGAKKSEINDPMTFYKNVLIFENIINHKHRCNTFITFGSGAEFDKTQDLDCVSECNVGDSIPTDYYGLSKYIINRRLKQIGASHCYNLRLFGCFGENEQDTRFIKAAINCLKNNKTFIIDQDKYMDFCYIKDVIKVCDHLIYSPIQEKNLTLCYEQKYKLTDIVKMIDWNIKFKVEKEGLAPSYTGNGNNVASRFNLMGLQAGINEMKSKLL